MGLIRTLIERLTLKPYRGQLLAAMLENTAAINDLRHQLFIEKPVALIRNTKIYLPLFYVDHIQSQIHQNKDFYERDTLDFLKLHYKSLPFIIDIGSNIGNHALYFVSQLRAKRVECFEPNKKTFETLEKNIEINAYNDIVKAHNKALGSKSSYGIEKGYTVFNTGLNSIDETTKTGDTNLISVCKLDDFGYEAVNLLKIDVEGHELEVLKGAEETIRSSKPIILIEAFEGNLNRVETLLDSFEYKIFFRPEKDNYIFVPF